MSNTVETEEELVARYTPLVHKIAYKIHKTLSTDFLISDIEQYGFEGLINAIRHCDYSGTKRMTSYFGIRIHGAIIDGIRSEVWATRQAYKDLKGTEDSSILYMNSANVPIISAKGIHMSADLIDTTESDTIRPEEYADIDQLYNDLQYVVNNLPKKDNDIFNMYHIEEKTFNDIGKKYNFTVGRAHQVHKSVIKKIKTNLQRMGHVL